MPVVPLDNAAWGFESSCFVCEPKNARGLQVGFSHDTDAALVTADLHLGPEFSGAPQYVHGGVVLAVLDEAMAWAAIAVGRRFAFTQETSTTFSRPVRVDGHYRVEGRLCGQSAEAIEAEAVVLDQKDRACARSRARLVPLSAEQARQAMGVSMEGPDAGFVETGRE